MNSYNNYENKAYIGFIRGNYFDNLYDQYKNYIPKNIDSKNEKEYLLYMVMAYGNAMHDLTLYLDVYPDSSDVINLRYQYQKLYKEYLNQYESKFGPLNLESPTLDNAAWLWDSKYWPWEDNKNV